MRPHTAKFIRLIGAAIVPIFVILISQLLPAQTYIKIHDFSGRDGKGPVGSLAVDAAGNLYGTTTQGGNNENGTVFRLHNTSSGWVFTTLYKFKGGMDGSGPGSGVTLGSDGTVSQQDRPRQPSIRNQHNFANRQPRPSSDELQNQSRDLLPTQVYSGVFSNIYFYPPDKYDTGEVGESVVQLGNGNIIAVGVDSNIRNWCPSGAFGGGWIMEMTPSGGNTVSQQLYGSCSYEGAYLLFVTPTNDGGALGTGNDLTFADQRAWMIKFTSTGTTQWQEELRAGGGIGQFAPKQLSDGSYFGVGVTAPEPYANNYGLMVHLSSTGAVLSHSAYTESASSFPGALEGGGLDFRSTAPATPGNAVISGIVETHDEHGYGWAFVAAKTAVDGSPTFKVYYGSQWSSDAPGQSNYRILPTTDGNFILTGTVRGTSYPFQACFLFAKLDAELNLIPPSLGYCGSPWIYGSWGVDAAPVNDVYGRGFILSGDSGDTPGHHDDGQLIRLDEAGNILWQTGQSGEATGDSVVWNGVVQINGVQGIGFAAAGYSYVGSPSYGGAGFGVMTTDSQGHLGLCRCWHTTYLVPTTLDLQAYDATFTPETIPVSVAGSPLRPNTTMIVPERLYVGPRP